jgi:hypothetical protein
MTWRKTGKPPNAPRTPNGINRSFGAFGVFGGSLILSGRSRFLDRPSRCSVFRQFWLAVAPNLLTPVLYPGAGFRNPLFFLFL